MRQQKHVNENYNLTDDFPNEETSNRKNLTHQHLGGSKTLINASIFVICVIVKFIS